MKKLLIILSIFILTSCTVSEVLTNLKELKVAFTNTDNKAIDSMKITSPLLVFAIYNNDLIRTKELKKDGYFIKYNYDSTLITITVQRKDSVIYFYRK